MHSIRSIIGGMALLAAVVAPMSRSDAAEVRVFGEALSGFSLSTINSFYDGLAGYNSEILPSLTAGSLTGVQLLWATQPSDSYSAGELAVMSSFLAGGGRIAFLGEHGTFGAAQNLRINAALAVLGATISINNVLVDPGYRTASVGDGQILSHSLTEGVNSYRYAAFAPLTISGTAQALMRGEDNPNAVMMAFQNIGAGSVFLITDQNVWDSAPSWGSYDNGRMFQNLATGDTGIAVPEPAGMALFGLGLLGLAALRRRG